MDRQTSAESSSSSHTTPRPDEVSANVPQPQEESDPVSLRE